MFSTVVSANVLDLNPNYIVDDTLVAGDHVYKILEDENVFLFLEDGGMASYRRIIVENKTKLDDMQSNLLDLSKEAETVSVKIQELDEKIVSLDKMKVVYEDLIVEEDQEILSLEGIAQDLNVRKKEIQNKVTSYIIMSQGAFNIALVIFIIIIIIVLVMKTKFLWSSEETTSATNTQPSEPSSPSSSPPSTPLPLTTSNTTITTTYKTTQNDNQT